MPPAPVLTAAAAGLGAMDVAGGGIRRGRGGWLTNVPGTLVIIYFYSLRLAKAEFLSSVAFSFIVYKLVQLGSVAWFGLLTWPVLGASVALTLAGLSGFALRLRVQDRLEQQASTGWSWSRCLAPGC